METCRLEMPIIGLVDRRAPSAMENFTEIQNDLRNERARVRNDANRTGTVGGFVTPRSGIQVTCPAPSDTVTWWWQNRATSTPSDCDFPDRSPTLGAEEAPLEREAQARGAVLRTERSSTLAVRASAVTRKGTARALRGAERRVPYVHDLLIRCADQARAIRQPRSGARRTTTARATAAAARSARSARAPRRAPAATSTPAQARGARHCRATHAASRATARGRAAAADHSRLTRAARCRVSPGFRSAALTSTAPAASLARSAGDERRRQHGYPNGTSTNHEPF
jgi:hypothetical protein